ncbi:uncharacterized protein LOC130522862 [Takifugu flavidus]|uniref:uncharacterized protein LOC130522862 n=1 Tax=Takifugu flavidus TaxID=433684 RepID=UPI002544741F|nr:uncharacterized protein LOC130522862 [Takifugu flavidus]
MKMINASSSNGSSSKEPFFLELECILTSPGTVNVTIFYLTNVLLMFPACVLILYLGLHQWWQQRFTSTTAMKCHSDIFIYHLVVMELVGVLGCILCCIGIQTNMIFFILGAYLWNIPRYGEGLFHILTCVERYLAVVHPITYLRSKSDRGIRIRNICIGCAWLICFTGTIAMAEMEIFRIINYICLLSVMLVLFFCSISILCILIRPGPGDKPGSRGMSNQSKKKAFYIIMIILGAVSLRLLSNLAWVVLTIEKLWDCIMFNCAIWFNLPCTLVLPLLFLQRSVMLIKNKVLHCPFTVRQITNTTPS